MVLYLLDHTIVIGHLRSADYRTLDNEDIIGAQITLSGQCKYLGNYRTEIEAARAYNNAALEHFGEHAYLNVIGP